MSHEKQKEFRVKKSIRDQILQQQEAEIAAETELKNLSGDTADEKRRELENTQRTLGALRKVRFVMKGGKVYKE